MEEAKVSNLVLTKLVAGHITLKHDTDSGEFQTPKIQEQMKILGHLNILVSCIHIHIL
jgi:hypothetical protein